MDAMLALPAGQFAATLDVAQDVVAGCGTYTYNTRVRDAILQTHATGRAVAPPNEVDVTRRSFQARHDITLGQDNTCAAIVAEITAVTPMSALFQPL